MLVGKELLLIGSGVRRCFAMGERGLDFIGQVEPSYLACPTSQNILFFI